MSTELPPIDDPVVVTILAGLRRGAYTLSQHRDEVIQMSNGAQYEDVAAGRLLLTKRGSRSYITALDAARHLALLRLESERAVTRVDALFREKGAGFSGIELWDRARRVERVMKDDPEQIRRWRMKAEEIRTAADGFGNRSASQALRNAAETYDALANAAEARVQGRKDRESDAG